MFCCIVGSLRLFHLCLFTLQMLQKCVRYTDCCWQEFCVELSDKASVPASLILILSRLCYDLDQSTIGYLVFYLITLVGLSVSLHFAYFDGTL